MALVKCPKHKIPYNDANPRGCPACALEKEGGGMMQELARASQVVRRPGSTPSASVDLDQPVSRQPRIPLPSVRRFAQLFLLLRNRRNAMVAGAIIMLLLLLLVVSRRTRFTEAPSPVVYNGVVRPFPVSPNDPITMVFSAL